MQYNIMCTYIKLFFFTIFYLLSGEGPKAKSNHRHQVALTRALAMIRPLAKEMILLDPNVSEKAF